MKIASWNVNSLKVRMPHLGMWLDSAKPDVVGLQETKSEDLVFPRAALEALGYRVVFHGQKTYNGVALLAREEPQDVQRGLPGFDDPQARMIAATVGDIRVVNFYVVNGQAVGSEKFEYKLRWLDAARAYLAAELLRHPRLVVMGDFNITPEDRDVHDPEAWREQILCSTPERDALRTLFALGLHDSFRAFEEGAGHYSWWDYRQAAFRRNLGLRIDLVLVSEALRAHLTAAGIDREPRTLERPSDHAPVWIELA